ncbi:major facilitator superfamily transporter [Ceratobasidium sp. AG-Ba]|nr:major facilitator superfamily transporter [Ceratobasidium sp. AG-Ba]
MSQVATCQIELDELPALERGRSLDQPKPQYTSSTDIYPEPQIYSTRTSTHASTIDQRYANGSAMTAESSGVRFGNQSVNVFIQDRILYLLGGCMGVFAVGLNDTATGANLPSMQEHYNLPYAVVSLVFLAGFGGYLVSCMLNSVLQNKIGTRWVLVLAGSLYAGGSLLISFTPPFPLVTVGLVLMGLGGGFYEACLTSVVSHFESSRFMNILYAFFGMGALVSPFIIGASAKAKVSWNLYYWFPFSLATIVTLCHFFLFKNYVIPSDEEVQPERRSVRAQYVQMIRMPITWVGIVLIILSFAITDTQSNWLTSYLIDVKGSGPDVSRYQLSMFWMGLTLGRIFFSLPFVHVRDRIGNNALLAALCGALVVFWKVQSTPTNWLMIGLAGFFLGPNTPGILSIVSARVPPSLKGMVLSITIGLGLVGATLGPLLFGVAVGKFGLQTLPPVIIVLACLSALMFWAIPPREKRD